MERPHRRPAQAAARSGGDVAPYIPLPDGLSDPRQTAGAVFDSIASLYDRVRPRYPAEAVDDLLDDRAVTASTRIIEIGCGTGQLTKALAGTGAGILAVEPGPALAALARANLAAHSAVEVRTARFEDLDAPPQSFDMVAAATSFHWVDPLVGYPKASRLLRPGGALVLITNAHTAGGSHTEAAFADAVRELHLRLAPEVGDWSFPTVEQVTERATAGGDIAAAWARVDRTLAEPPDVSRWFAPPTVRAYPWMASYGRDDYLGLLASQSTYALMRVAERAALLERIGSLVDDLLGGRVTKQYLTVTAVAQAG